MYRLIYLTGKMKGRRVAVQQGSVLIGRDPSCHIDLADDDTVSHKHALIEQRADGVYIKDLGSMNKIEVNGQQVTEAKLNSHDKIEIGKTVLEFQQIEAPMLTGRRRISRVQVFTFLAIFVIVLVEVLFVFLFPAWHEGEISSPVIPSVKMIEEPPPPAAATGLDAELAAAAAQIEAEAPSAPPPVAEPAPEPVAATATPAPVAVEIQQIKEAVADLKRQISDITTPAMAAVTQEVAAIPVEAPPAREPFVDPLVERATAMLKEAQAEIARSDLVKADQILERILVMAPEFLPAYIERARLAERRGQLKKAGEQWTEVMERSMGTPLYQEAAAERQRLARAEAIQEATSKTRTERALATKPLPQRIRIMSIEREKFQSSKEYDEMRLLRIALRPRASEGHIDGDDVRVAVTFYDRIMNTDDVQPSRASTPQDGLRLDAVWPAGETRTVTATYILPKNFRKDEEDTYGEKRIYEGYRVQVYFRGELQDEDAMPKSLLAMEAPPLPDSLETSRPLRRR